MHSGSFHQLHIQTQVLLAWYCFALQQRFLAVFDVSKTKATRANRGTGKIKYDKNGNEPEKQELPKFQDLIDKLELDRNNKNTLKDMIRNENLDIQGSLSAWFVAMQMASCSIIGVGS